MPDDAAKGFRRSALLDAAGLEQCVEPCATSAYIHTSQHHSAL